MRKYLILYKVVTVAELVEEFNYQGYSFKWYSPSWWEDDCWVVSKEIVADNAAKARVEFVRGLIPIIEQCSAISQCAFRFTIGSFIIYRLESNPEKIVFIYYVKDVGHTGLHFGPEESSQLVKVENIRNKKGFMYIMDAANCVTFYSRLAMLMSAVEAFAGEVISGKIRRTNQVEMKNILGRDFYEKLYAYGDGLRHKLIHGNIDNHEEFDGLTEIVYAKLREYLITKYDINIEKNVVNPLRNFHDNFVYTKMFMQFRGEPILNLKDIEDELSERRVAKDKTVGEIFSIYMPGIKDY